MAAGLIIGGSDYDLPVWVWLWLTFGGLADYWGVVTCEQLYMVSSASSWITASDVIAAIFSSSWNIFSITERSYIVERERAKPPM